MDYAVQIVNEFGGPGEDRVFSAHEVDKAMAWMEQELKKGASKVNIFKCFGKRIATLRSLPGRNVISRFEDFLIFDCGVKPCSAAEMHARRALVGRGSMIDRSAELHERRTVIEPELELDLEPPKRSPVRPQPQAKRGRKRASSVDLGSMITDAVADLKE